MWITSASNEAKVTPTLDRTMMHTISGTLSQGSKIKNGNLNREMPLCAMIF